MIVRPPPEAEGADGQTAPVFPGILIFLASLWDVYIGGIRPLDLMAVALALFIWIIAANRPIARGPVLTFLALTSLVAIESIRGVISTPDSIKPVIGVLLGALMAILVSASSWPAARLATAIKSVTWIHIVAFWAQKLVYQSSGIILNYFSPIGLTPRLESSIFRPAGLYLEPAAFCLMMISFIVLLRFLNQRGRLLENVVLVSIVGSISLWGMGGVLVYMLIFRPVAALVIAAFLAVWGGVLVSVGIIDPTIIEWVLKRVGNIGSDRSANARYSPLSILSHPGSPEIWFGRGITNDYSWLGASSLSFIVTAGGLLGICYFTAIWVLSLSPPRRMSGMLIFLLMLSAAPIWTMVWWWMWLALMVIASEPSADRAVGRSAHVFIDSLVRSTSKRYSPAFGKQR